MNPCRPSVLFDLLFEQIRRRPIDVFNLKLELRIRFVNTHRSMIGPWKRVHLETIGCFFFCLSTLSKFLFNEVDHLFNDFFDFNQLQNQVVQGVDAHSYD